MGKNVTVDFKEFERLGEQVAQIQKEFQRDFFETCAKEVTQRFLRKVIKRTPVGVYDKPVNFTTKDGKVVSFTPNTGKKGGTLKRAWRANNKNLRVIKSGSFFCIEIVNPIEYASYVEFGHSTPKRDKWIDGYFMMTISANEVENMAPALLQKRVEQKLREAFK